MHHNNLMHEALSLHFAMKLTLSEVFPQIICCFHVSATSCHAGCAAYQRRFRT